MKSKDFVGIDNLVLKVETDKAFGVSEGSKSEIKWIPKSQVDNHTLEKHKPGAIFIPVWLADKLEFDYDEDSYEAEENED